MPTRPIDRQALPFVRPAYEPDTRTLRDLMMLAGQSRANAVGRQGQVRAQGLMSLGQLISEGLGSFRQGKEREQVMAAQAQRQQQEDALKMRDQQLREADLLARIEERELAGQERAQANAYKRGSEVAEEVGYGPMSEPQMESVLQGPAAGRARYSFGPGTAEGPELQPTQQQQRGIEVEKSINAMGGQVGPNGQVVMPPKVDKPPTPEERLSGESLLAYLAAQGNPGAKKALDVIRSQRPPQMQEPLEPVMGPDGFPIYAPRSRAVGQRVPTTREQPTEDERKTSGFYKQMTDAIAVIDEVEPQLTSKDIYQMNTISQEDLIGMANRGEMSEAAKRYLRAFEQFTEANLRPKSGAAIGPTEYARDLRTYGKQYSETPKLNEDRRRARAVALETLKGRAGRALPKDESNDKQKNNDPLGIRK